MEVILQMYITLLPAIFAGVLNMVWVKLSIFNGLKIPIDNNKILKDGKRLFGDNKTWKGFIGMVVLGGICTVIWGLICGNSGMLYENNLIYRFNENTIIFNILVGLGVGLAYVLCELPNSFIKRRVGITPGKSTNGLIGMLFIMIDQVDSVFGCVLVISLFYPMALGYYLIYVFLGGVTHYILNVLLYLSKLKRNI